MRFILASSSPRRREIIRTMLDHFEVIKPQIDETQQQGEAPHAYVKRLAQEKAQAVAAQIQAAATILAADTIVILAADTIGIEADGDILGKPQDADEARAMLKRLRNRAHQVCTAFTLLHGSYAHTEVVCTMVHMRDYTDDEIEAYIASGDPFDKAGSYAIQHAGFRPVREVEGSYSNVVGLPADEVRAALHKMGIVSHKDAVQKPLVTTRIGHEILSITPTDVPVVPQTGQSIPLTGCILIVQRGEEHLWYYNPQREQWELPGGSIKANEHPDETAKRALYEKTNQVAAALQCRGLMKVRLYPDFRLEYAAIYSASIDTLQPFVANAESEKIRWWNMQDPIDRFVSEISQAVLRFSVD